MVHPRMTPTTYPWISDCEQKRATYDGDHCGDLMLGNYIVPLYYHTLFLISPNVPELSRLLV